MQVDPESVWSDIQAIKKFSPLVHLSLTERKPGPLGLGGSSAPPFELKIKLYLSILLPQ